MCNLLFVSVSLNFEKSVSNIIQNPERDRAVIAKEALQNVQEPLPC